MRVVALFPRLETSWDELRLWSIVVHHQRAHGAYSAQNAKTLKSPSVAIVVLELELVQVRHHRRTLKNHVPWFTHTHTHTRLHEKRDAQNGSKWHAFLRNNLITHQTTQMPVLFTGAREGSSNLHCWWKVTALPQAVSWESLVKLWLANFQPASFIKFPPCRSYSL